MPNRRAAARAALVVLVAAVALVAGAAYAQPAALPPLPRSRLAVRAGDAWRTWWRSDSAPARWGAARADVAGAVRWHAVGPGLEWGTLALAGSGEAWRLRVVLVRIDPARHRLRLAEGDDGTLLGDGRWTVDSAPAGAAVALNAGQFRYGTPWGWVVLDGEERLPPRRAPLAMALAVDSAGRPHWLADGAVDGARAALRPVSAFQSYPALLVGDGEVPAPLRAPSPGLDVAHRDARLAIGETRDGRLLVALTRFDALGGAGGALGDALGRVPLGLTVPEAAALMGALGCRRAMLLDGGISAQLLVRDAGGRARAWRGLRPVPLGIVVTPRASR